MEQQHAVRPSRRNEPSFRLRQRVVVLVERGRHILVLQAVLEGRPLKRLGFDDDDVEDVLDPARLAVSEADAALVIRSRVQQLPRVGFIVCRLEGEIVIGPVGEAQSKRAKHSTSLERSIALGLG